jgi:hypothetical protein
MNKINKKLIFFGLASALGEAIYIALVALFMTNINKLLGVAPNILGMVAFLMLFVLSAALSGALILGKPVLLYLENSKKEALQLFGITLGWLFIFLLILFGILII